VVVTVFATSKKYAATSYEGRVSSATRAVFFIMLVVVVVVADPALVDRYHMIYLCKARVC
jgi:hypothetical protein